MGGERYEIKWHGSRRTKRPGKRPGIGEERLLAWVVAAHAPRGVPFAASVWFPERTYQYPPCGGDPSAPEAVRSTLAPRPELVNTHPVTQGTKRGRRNSMRVPCGLRVEVQTSPEPVKAEVMNISQKGLFLRSDARTPIDALRLSTSLTPDRPFYLVLQFRGELTPTRARSRVAWKSDLGIGINFDDAPERLRDFISDLQDSSSIAAILSQVESGRIEFS